MDNNNLDIIITVLLTSFYWWAIFAIVDNSENISTGLPKAKNPQRPKRPKY